MLHQASTSENLGLREFGVSGSKDLGVGTIDPDLKIADAQIQIRFLSYLFRV